MQFSEQDMAYRKNGIHECVELARSMRGQERQVMVVERVTGRTDDPVLGIVGAPVYAEGYPREIKAYLRAVSLDDIALSNGFYAVGDVTGVVLNNMLSINDGIHYNNVSYDIIQVITVPELDLCRFTLRQASEVSADV